jgi:phosphohistidine phosphatase
MKVVYFVRHAKSSWADPSLKDFDRPLNKRGLRDAPFMGKLMNAKAGPADLLLSSPAVRARTTAEYFAHALGIDKENITLEAGIYEAFPAELINILQKLDDELQTVMLFGHNPALTSIANLFSEEPIANVPTCGVFKVEATVARWEAFNESVGRLTEFHYPKQYFS